jgi:hypothetical protein
LKIQQEIVSTASCETLQASGHNAPGYYLIDTQEQLGTQQYEVVKCNMGAELSDPDFQQTTGVKLHKHLPVPIAFDFRRTSHYGAAGTVVPYEEAVLNLGNAMSLNGVFTVPVNGTYQFTFAANKGGNDAPTYMYLRVDGQEVGCFYGYSAYDSMAEIVILELRAGQEVDTYFRSGDSMFGNADLDMHFIGHLLFAS